MTEPRAQRRSCSRSSARTTRAWRSRPTASSSSCWPTEAGEDRDGQRQGHAHQDRRGDGAEGGRRAGVHLRSRRDSSRRSSTCPRSPTSTGPTTTGSTSASCPHRQQLRLRRAAQRDARRGERVAHRRRFNAAQPNTDETAELGCSTTSPERRRRQGGRGGRWGAGGQGGVEDHGGRHHQRIDGRSLTADIDFYALLNRKVGEQRSCPCSTRTNARWDETVKPIEPGRERAALRALGAPATGGGQFPVPRDHRLRPVRSMNDASMRTVFDKVMGWMGKEGVIVDTRFNGGATSTSSSPTS